jgi:hypothetical protein
VNHDHVLLFLEKSNLLSSLPSVTQEESQSFSSLDDFVMMKNSKGIAREIAKTKQSRRKIPFPLDFRSSSSVHTLFLHSRHSLRVLSTLKDMASLGEQVDKKIGIGLSRRGK